MKDKIKYFNITAEDIEPPTKEFIKKHNKFQKKCDEAIAKKILEKILKGDEII